MASPPADAGQRDGSQFYFVAEGNVDEVADVPPAGAAVPPAVAGADVPPAGAQVPVPQDALALVPQDQALVAVPQCAVVPVLPGALPRRILIGPERNNYVYDLIRPTLYRCIRNAQGFDSQPDNVLFLFMVLDANGPVPVNYWMAVHAHVDAAEDVVRNTGQPIFMSNDLNVTQSGNHAWSYYNLDREAWMPLNRAFMTTVIFD